MVRETGLMVALFMAGGSQFPTGLAGVMLPETTVQAEA
jgi:hypothetical protein